MVAREEGEDGDMIGGGEVDCELGELMDCVNPLFCACGLEEEDDLVACEEANERGSGVALSAMVVKMYAVLQYLCSPKSAPGVGDATGGEQDVVARGLREWVSIYHRVSKGTEYERVQQPLCYPKLQMQTSFSKTHVW